MRHRFMFLAVLAGIALTLLGPVRPAAADDGVDCTEVFVVDPTLCDDDLPPADPPPSRPPTMFPGDGGGTTQPMPNGPQGMMPTGPGEVCDGLTFDSDAVIDEAGRPDVLIYTFRVRVDYCILGPVVTQARVVPSVHIVQPQDIRIQSVSLPVVFLGPQGVGTPLFRQGQDVFTEFSPDLVNTRTFRHFILVDIRANPALRPVEVVVDLFECANPATC